MTEKKLTTNACAPVVDNQNVIAGPRGPASSDGAAQKSTPRALLRGLQR